MRVHRLFFCLPLVAACEPDDWGPERLGRGRIDPRIEELRLGRAVYGDYCAGCHGEKGDGEGPAARFLEPKPRDFRLGRVKFASVEGGSSPRDEDYLRILDSGLMGTAMPRFNLLPLEQKRAVVTYLKTFYPEAHEDPPGAPVSAGQDPWTQDRPGGIAAGKVAYYTVATCWSCHPAYESEADILKIFSEAALEPPSLRPNIREPETKESNWGAPIKAPDFLADRIKTGFDVESIARVIASGVGGTAMPTWAGSLEPEQIWGIAYYVNDLALKRGRTKGN
jgi:mono/diheme cytochrome c family protein